VIADHHRDDFEIKIFRITADSDEFVFCELITEFSQGEWSGNRDIMYLMDAVDAAKDKARTYHCRVGCYVGAP
jgi:hypothetical protein